MNAFEKNVNKKLEEILELENGTITGDTEFESLSIDSLDLLTLSTWLDSEYEITLGVIKLSKLKYVKDLYEYNPYK